MAPCPVRLHSGRRRQLPTDGGRCCAEGVAEGFWLRVEWLENRWVPSFWGPVQPVSIRTIDPGDSNGNSETYRIGISVDGRFVAFTSDASNLVAGDSNAARDVFVTDLQTGQTTCVSTDTAGNQANGGSGYYAALSGDGRFVAFYSAASNLVAGDTSYGWDVFVKDLQTGQTIRASTDMPATRSTAGPSLPR